MTLPACTLTSAYVIRVLVFCKVSCPLILRHPSHVLYALYRRIASTAVKLSVLQKLMCIKKGAL